MNRSCAVCDGLHEDGAQVDQLQVLAGAVQEAELVDGQSLAHRRLLPVGQHPLFVVDDPRVELVDELHDGVPLRHELVDVGLQSGFRYGM